MILDEYDCTFNSVVTGPIGRQTKITTVRHKPTDIFITTPDQDRRTQMDLLRNEIRRREPSGEPDKLVIVTKQGTQRIPNSYPGMVYVVRDQTPSPCGTYVNVHITDAANNTWTLSKGDYTVFPQPRPAENFQAQWAAADAAEAAQFPLTSKAGWL